MADKLPIHFKENGFWSREDLWRTAVKEILELPEGLLVTASSPYYYQLDWAWFIPNGKPAETFNAWWHRDTPHSWSIFL